MSSHHPSPVRGRTSAARKRFGIRERKRQREQGVRPDGETPAIRRFVLAMSAGAALRGGIVWCLGVACWLTVCCVANAQDATLTSDTDVEATEVESLRFDRSPELPDVDPVDPETLRDAVRGGVRFLLDNQNANGSWGSATRTKGLNIYAPVPGAHHAFRAATTSLCIAALAELRETAAAEVSSELGAEVDASLERAEAWLFEHLPDLRRATGDAIYNVWGHAYSIQALVRLHRRAPDDEERRGRIEELIRDQMEKLDRYESVDGGWGYYDFRYQAKQPTSSSISFVGGTVLVAFHEASEIGIEPSSRIVRRAVAAINRQRKPDFSYLYGEYLKDRPMRGINRPGGSLGRSQCCNLALRLWGDEAVTDHIIEHWLVRLYERNGWLDIGRKRPIPHEAWFQVAGYFYYYGHYYAAMSIAHLPVESREPYRAMLARLIVPLQEENGAWWDYPLYDYHEPYGTSLALMTLYRCFASE